MADQQKNTLHLTLNKMPVKYNDLYADIYQKEQVRDSEKFFRSEFFLILKVISFSSFIPEEYQIQ